MRPWFLYKLNNYFTFRGTPVNLDKRNENYYKMKLVSIGHTRLEKSYMKKSKEPEKHLTHYPPWLVDYKAFCYKRE